MSSHLSDQQRIAGRDGLLARAVATFAQCQASAVHQFGSLARGAGDALSDLDLWLTFPDDTLPAVLQRRQHIYSEIAPVVITHEVVRNSPRGGRYTLVIHRVPAGLYHVDYYLAPRSTSVILPEARVLYGDDALPRGPWLLEQSASSSESVSERVDWLICMAFIGIKAVRRGDTAFMVFLTAQYHRFIERYNLGLAALGDDRGLPMIEQLLGHLAVVADSRQRRAIEQLLRRALPLGYAHDRRYA